jgi:hypothetical protein
LNILRKLLEERPNAIDDAALEVRELAGESLGAAVLDVAYPFFEGGIDEGLFFEQMSGAYVPIVDYQRWEFAETEVEAESPEDRGEMNLGSGGSITEWTTFVRGSEWRGVLLPEDDGSEEVVSVFARFGGFGRALRFFRRGQDIHVSMNVNHHCGLADATGRCQPGTCGGCQARRRLVRPRGIVCLCGHS